MKKNVFLCDFLFYLIFPGKNDGQINMEYQFHGLPWTTMVFHGHTTMVNHCQTCFVTWPPMVDHGLIPVNIMANHGRGPWPWSTIVKDHSWPWAKNKKKIVKFSLTCISFLFHECNACCIQPCSSIAADTGLIVIVYHHSQGHPWFDKNDQGWPRWKHGWPWSTMVSRNFIRFDHSLPWLTGQTFWQW